MSSTRSTFRTCSRCGNPYERTGHNQRYCPDCRPITVREKATAYRKGYTRRNYNGCTGSHYLGNTRYADIRRACDDAYVPVTILWYSLMHSAISLCQSSGMADRPASIDADAWCASCTMSALCDGYERTRESVQENAHDA